MEGREARCGVWLHETKPSEFCAGLKMGEEGRVWSKSPPAGGSTLPPLWAERRRERRGVE